MEMIRFENVRFTYPLADHPALSEVSFSVSESEFLVVCGKSGCGKTSLLRQMKKNLIPYGELTGDVLYCGEPVESLDDRRSASEIGFVQQNPDNQIVTDKVWHELAFGLESLGLDNATIRRRVAEMASFFGIQTWYYKNVTELSGGQMQLLNLASIMVMQPELLILDEPTSQLDPIAAGEFLATLGKINRELGTTVILSEHRLEDALPLSDRVNIVLTTNTDYTKKDAIIAHSVDELLEMVKDIDDEVFVIGGGTVYNQLLPYCDKAIVTRIDHAYEADTFFPDLDKDEEWKITDTSEEQTYFDLTYHFVTYERV